MPANHDSPRVLPTETFWCPPPRSNVQDSIIAGIQLHPSLLTAELQSQLLLASTELIVSRAEPSEAAAGMGKIAKLSAKPIARIDSGRTVVTANHDGMEFARASEQLRQSLRSIRNSVQRFDPPQSTTQPSTTTNVSSPKTSAAVLSSTESIKASLASLAKRFDARHGHPRVHESADSEKLPLPTLKPVPKPNLPNRPRLWRRWIRLDRVMEAQSQRWQSQASRLGVRVDFKFDAPTGQEIWTDVDIILHIIDQFVASMLAQGKRGSAISIVAGIHPEDAHWMQIAVRSPHARKDSQTLDRTGNPKVFEVARRYATMLGGFLDQFSGQELGLCWKFHFPIDDILSWLRRARTAEHQHVVEVELLASHAEVLDNKHWMFADRAFQAALDARDRAIMMSPRRYLLTSFDPFTDVASLRRRFQLQLDRIGANLLAGESQTFDLRCQQLGTLQDILSRILARIQQETQWKGPQEKKSAPAARTTVEAKKESPVRPPIHTTHFNGAHVHGAHAMPASPKRKPEVARTPTIHRP